MEQIELSPAQSQCLLIAVALKSTNGQPRPYVFGDFRTFLYWREQNLSDIISYHVQSIPYVCEEVVPLDYMPILKSAAPDVSE